MKFFVPGASDDEVEMTLALLAGSFGLTVPTPNARVFSLEWESRGEIWKATVGERNCRVEPLPERGDVPAVLAIFPGPPFMIVTATQPVIAIRSEWNNPITAGLPPNVRNVLLFDDA